MAVPVAEAARIEAARQAAAPQTATAQGALAATFQSQQTQVHAHSFWFQPTCSPANAEFQGWR
jgi:hypothetical protein